MPPSFAFDADAVKRHIVAIFLTTKRSVFSRHLLSISMADSELGLIALLRRTRRPKRWRPHTSTSWALV